MPPLFVRLLPIAVVCCLNLVACASFPGKQLPIYTYEQIVAHDPKPSIGYDAKFFTLGQENVAAVTIFHEEIQKVFKKSNVFSKFSAGIGSEDYHLYLVLKNETNRALASLSGFISGLTFTIIPAYAREEYILTVEVKKGDKSLKYYQYVNYMDDWIQLFLIFLTPWHWPPDVARGIIENMLLNFLHDAEKDKVFEVLPDRN